MPDKEERKIEKKSERSEQKKIEEEGAEGIKLKLPKKYFYAIGRRKTARAQIWMFRGDSKFVINGLPAETYFPNFEQRLMIDQPFDTCGQKGRWSAIFKVKGGGKSAQAQAVRLGLARALVKVNKNFKVPLKKAGYIKRDPREKERKKYGLKRARRAPQWQKR